MRKTKENRSEGRLALTTPELCASLGCGRDTAIKLGKAAGARLQVGRRVLWSAAKINDYICGISEGA